jgi:hypothetical protein
MIAAAILLAAAVPHAAPMAQAACSATPAPLPAGMESWARPVSAKASDSAAKATPLALETAVTAALLPTPKVAYAVRPEKPGGSVSSGGLFAFVVPTAGRYRVALGSGAWIDVLSGTTPSVSVAHGHGPECSTIRKMVDFDLQPGRYLLQVAGNGTPSMPLMVTRLP